MPTLRSSVVGYKAAFTRSIRAAECFLTDEIVADSLLNGKNLLDKAKVQYQKLEEAYGKICDTEPSDVEELYEELNAEHIRLTDLNTKIIARFKIIETSIAEATANANASFTASSTSDTPLSTGFCREPVVEMTLKPFTLTRDHTPQEFRTWAKQFKQYFESGYISKKPLKFQRAFFDRCLDDNLQSDMADYILPSTDVVGPSGCLKILEDRFKDLYPIFNRRWKYFRATRNPGEDSDAFLTRLVALYKEADVDSLTKHDNLLFVFLAGDKDDEIRRIVSHRESTSLEDLRMIVNRRTRYLREDSAISGSSASSIHPATAVASIGPSGVVTPRPVAPRATPQQTGCPPRFSRPVGQGRNQGIRRSNIAPRCPCCGSGRHQADACYVKARGLHCHLCGQPGHISPVCRRPQQTANVGAVVPIDVGAVGPAVDVGTMVPAFPEVDDLPEVTPRLPATISNSSGKFKFKCFPDTGSGASLISSDLVLLHGFNVQKREDNTVYVTVNGQRLTISGKVHVIIELDNGVVAEICLLVSPDVRQEVLLGYKSLKLLGIVSETFPVSRVSAPFVSSSETNTLKMKLAREFSSILTSQLPREAMIGGYMDIHLNDRVDIPPTKVSTAQPIPLHFQKEADEIIDKALREGIIERVSQPTEWCSPAFFVKKPGGGLRLVTDFTGLNKRVKRPVHPFPAPQSIISGLDPRSTVFAKADALSGYHQVALKDSASYLTSFILPSGVYRYLRAPMGLSSSSDEFCRRSDAVFAGIRGVRKLVDDLLIEGRDLADLEKKLREVFQRCADNGFILSLKKFEIGTSVEFAGFVVSDKGVFPSPKRLAAIAEFPVPKDITALRGFLGLCNQLAIFVPNLAALSSGLRELLKKNVVFRWLPDHSLQFSAIKKALVGRLSLHHFDERLHTKLVTDASKLNGIGFILMQTTSVDSDVPVSVLQCGSRSLNDAERNYSTIELECLAIQYALHKCDFFLRGLEGFTVVTDHRPLVGVFGKALTAIDNPRLVRIREKTSPYSFEVKWLAGKQNVIADALSRNPISGGDNRRIFSCLVGGSGMVSRLREAATSCPNYRDIFEAFQLGKDPRCLPDQHPARQLLGVWNELSIIDSNLLCIDGKRIFVPLSCPFNFEVVWLEGKSNAIAVG